MDATFWNNVYETKAENAVSWYQETPNHSLDKILSLDISKTAEIIDIGGGQSKLTRFLYENHFHNLTILDISKVAIEKTKASLNNFFPENQISTITSNIIDAQFTKKFDVWHDRAVFHFLTSPSDQAKYAELLFESLKPNAYFLIYTFSKSGPKKCSGLEICQNEAEDLEKKFSRFKLIETENINHETPFCTIQNFTYCLFRK